MPVFQYSDAEKVGMRCLYPLCRLNPGMVKIVMTNKSADESDCDHLAETICNGCGSVYFLVGRMCSSSVRDR
jgi:hypothetical protein